MPVIGFLNPNTAEFARPLVTALKLGLKEAGYIDGQSVAIEFRWAEGRYDRLSEMAIEFVRRRVTVIIAISTASSLAAKAATTTIPIVFAIAEDPVETWSCRQHRPAGRQRNRYQFFQQRVDRKAPRPPS